MGGCPRCTTIADLKRTIPLGLPLLVLGYFVAPWRQYAPDTINEPLKKFIIAAIFLIGLIVLGYVFFRARRRCGEGHKNGNDEVDEVGVAHVQRRSG